MCSSDLLQNQADFDKKYREHLNTEYNAVQEPSAGEVLQRPQERAGKAGGKRGGVEQGVKGPEVTEEGKAKGKEGEEVVPPVPPAETTLEVEQESDPETVKIANAVNDAYVKGKYGVDALNQIIGKLQDTDLQKIYEKVKEIGRAHV